MKSHHPAGFTIVELLVALTIAAILMAIAVPSFKDFITRTAVENLQDRLAGAITFARSEAATRNAVVTLCSSDDGIKCVADTWKTGWIVFVDNNGNKTIDGGEEILQRQQMASNAYPISFMEEGKGLNDPTKLSELSFTSQGFVRGEIRAFAIFCAEDEKLNRGLTVERSGRVMKGATIALDSTTPKEITLKCK